MIGRIPQRNPGRGINGLLHIDFMGGAGQAGNGDDCGKADRNVVGSLGRSVFFLVGRGCPFMPALLLFR